MSVCVNGNGCLCVIKLGDCRIEEANDSVEETRGSVNVLVENELSQIRDDEDSMSQHPLLLPMSSCVGATALVMVETPTLSKPRPPIAWELVTATA